MKLISITFGTTPRLPGIRATDVGKIDLDKPSDAIAGWRLVLRGQSAFFISPAGWVPDRSQKRNEATGPVTIFEMPRAELMLQWACSNNEKELEDVLKGGKFESPVFGWKPAEVASGKPILAQIPASQMGDS